MAGNGSEHDDFEEPTEPSFTVTSPDPVAPALRPAMAIGARAPTKPSPSPPAQSPAPSSTTSQSLRVVPATSVPPTPSSPASTTSQTVSNPRRGGGLVVHRATQPAMPAMSSSSSSSSSSSTGSFPAITPEVTDPRARPPTGSMPIVSSEMQEALAGLKPVRRGSTTSTSLPAISAPPGTKAEVSEALAALKPAVPSSAASRLPPRPTTSVGFDGPPTDPGTPSTKPARARFELPVSAAAFKRGAWGVVIAATVAAIVVLIPRDVVTPPVVVDLPVVAVPPTGLPCEQVTSRRTLLECHLRRTVYFALSPTERLQRLDVTRVAALNGHFTQVSLIDVGGTWHRLPTQPTPAPTPARVGVEIVDVPAEVPVTAARPKLLPATAAGSKTATKAKAP